MSTPTPRASLFSINVPVALFLFMLCIALLATLIYSQVVPTWVWGSIGVVFLLWIVLDPFGAIEVAAQIVRFLAYSRHRRSKDMQEAAAAVGASFIRSVDGSLGKSLSQFGLLEGFGQSNGRTYNHRISNLCYRQGEGVYLAVFDYEYRTRDDQDHRVVCNHYRSALHVYSEKLQLPPLIVGRKGPLHKLTKMLPFFNKGFEVENSPDFAGRYIIRSEDEEAARRHFTPDVIRFFNEQPMPIVVEGREHELLCCFPNHGAPSGLTFLMSVVLLASDDESVSPTEVPSWIQLGAKLASLFAADNDEIVDAVMVDYADEPSKMTPPIGFPAEE